MAETPDAADTRPPVTIPAALCDFLLEVLKPFETFAGSFGVIGRSDYEIIDAEIWVHAYRQAREGRTLLREARERGSLPPALTPELIDVLDLMNFQTGQMARLFQATGVEIRHKCEDEQAYVLHWLMTLVAAHGSDWRRHAATEIDRRRALLAAGKDARPR